MSVSTLRMIFQRIFESPFVGDTLTVVWHSGEPLVLPIDFYEHAFAIADELRPRHVRIVHSFQTNGTLITEGWAKFLLDTGARIGVSLDGPQEIHDRHRRARSKGGSFARTISGIRILQNSAVPFHVITVLTAESMSHADKLYQFYKANGIKNVCFNIEEIESDHVDSSLSHGAAANQFRTFMKRILELVKIDPDPIWVREFAGVMNMFEQYSGQPIDNPQTTPFAIVSVDTEGNVSTFSPELLGTRSQRFGDFVIGNVHHQSLLDMSTNMFLTRMSREIRDGVEACRQQCEYFKFCNGGAPANKLFENSSFASTETMYCRLCRKALIDVVLEEIESRFELRDQQIKGATR